MRCESCGAENRVAARFCDECGARVRASPRRETRRTVTVLFSDVVESTSLGEKLDPETLRSIMARFYRLMREAIERHGGTVEKFIGDAVMAVFGLPTLHEDDALRAVRASSEMRDRLTGLNEGLRAAHGVALESRTGIETGEVVAAATAATRDGDADSLATGDVINTAARLEQAADPGEILVGEVTYGLVRDAIVAERRPPIEAKGKSAPLVAWRLLSAVPMAQGRARRDDAPLVGRELELARLRQTFREVVASRRCHFFTLLGAAGVGKSRLVREFIAELAEAATVPRGRCLPYGEAITYWPLGEVVRTAAAIEETDSRDEARAKLAALVSGGPDAARTAAAVGGAIGLELTPPPVEEIQRGTRALLELVARDRPVVVVVDDIHWAEHALLELLESVAEWTDDAPIMLLCMARPEFLENRPDWGGGKLNVTTILLEPLDQSGSETLLAHLPGGSALTTDLRRRITERAEGNPLFVEEMIGMLVDEGALHEADGTWQLTRSSELVRVPTSIRSLLAARMDRLSAAERSVVERASVVGRTFEGAAVAALTPHLGSDAVTGALGGLARKELVRPAREPGLGGERTYRFRHLLIRDAAYESLPKAERAALHQRLADWMERVVGDRLPEYQEIVAHHLEQAITFGRELGLEEEPELALRAARHLAAAGERAFMRADPTSTASLLARAEALAGADLEVRRRLPALVISLSNLEREAEEQEALERLERLAAETHDVPLQALVSILALEPRGGVRVPREVAVRTAEEAISRLNSVGERRGVARARLLIAEAELGAGKARRALEESERAMAAALQESDDREYARAVAHALFALLDGPKPLDDALSRARDLLDAAAAHRMFETESRYYYALMLASSGRHAAAQEESAKAQQDSRAMIASGSSMYNSFAGAIAWLAGDVQRAADVWREVIGEWQRHGQPPPDLLANLGLVLCELGREAEAVEIARRGYELSGSELLTERAFTALSYARTLARAGAPNAASDPLAIAVQLAATTDMPRLRGEVAVSQAEVALASGEYPRALERAEAARAEFVRKGARAFEAMVDRLEARIRAG